MAYEVIQADLAVSQPHVLNLWRESFPSLKDSRFPWLYQGNPSGPARVHLLRNAASGEIVGTTALFPRHLYSLGTKLRGAIAGDLAVDRKHRTLGPAIALQRAMLSQCDGSTLDLVYGFPNRKAEPLMSRLRYVTVAGMRELVLPVRSRYYIRRHIRWAWLNAPASLIVDQLLRIRAIRLRGRVGRRWTFSVDNTYGDDFDRLWRRVHAGYHLLGEKTAEYLRWRYGECPGREYRVFSMRSPEGELEGYLVYFVAGRRVSVVDYLANSEPGALEDLFNGFLSMQRRQGADVISISLVSSPDILSRFRAMGFHVRGEPNRLVVFAAEGHAALLDQLKTGPWYLVAGDNDV